MLEGLTTTNDLVDTNTASVGAGAAVVAKVTTDGGTINGADLVVLSQTYANDAAALAGMATAGSDTIAYQTALEDDDSFLVAYTDGTNSYIAVATNNGATKATTNDLDSVVTIVELTGVSSLANMDTNDYVVIAYLKKNIK